MTANPNDPFGAEHDDRDYAGKNLVKLGLSAPLVKPPPGHTYLFRTPSLEKEWQDSFARTANPASAPSAPSLDASPETHRLSAPLHNPDTAPDDNAVSASVPPAFPAGETADPVKPALPLHTGQPENSRQTGTPEPMPETPDMSGASPRTDAGLSAAAPTETGGNLRFPGTADERWQTVGNLLVRALARHQASTGESRPARSSGNLSTPVSPANGAPSGFMRTGHTPAAKQPKPVTGNGLPVNPHNPLCEPLPIRPLDKSVKTINGRRYVEPGPSREINALMTLANACYALGVNHPQVSLWEGGGKPFANVPYKKGQLNNKSGVTVASGLDIGQREESDELRNLGLPEKLVRKLAPYLGKKRGEAVDFLAKHPLFLTTEEIDLISRATMLNMSQNAQRQWDAKVKRERHKHPNAPRFHELTSDQQTLLFSRFYQNGNFEKRHKAFFEAVMDNDWDRAIGALQMEADSYTENPATLWRGNRLNKEIRWYNNLPN